LGAFVDKRLVFDVAIVAPVNLRPFLVISMYVVSQSGGSVEVFGDDSWGISSQDGHPFSKSHWRLMAHRSQLKLGLSGTTEPKNMLSWEMASQANRKTKKEQFLTGKMV
jgi:hypothetical protein